jgi:hypothetical protein
MEFWLDIMELFCSPGDSIYSIFGGTKTMHAANVSLPFNVYRFYDLFSSLEINVRALI